MTSADIDADQLLQEYWRQGGNDETAAHELRNHVLAARPSNALLAGRCLPVLDTIATEKWAARIEEFRKHAMQLMIRCQQIDQLGDQDTDPEAVFGILGDDIDDLSIEMFDTQALRQARIGKPSRAAAADAFLHTLGWGSLTPAAAAELRAAIVEMGHRTERFGGTALFQAPNGMGLALGVTVAGTAGDAVIGYSNADAVMNQQANAVLRYAYDGHGAQWGVEWEVGFGGSSIGLALWIAALTDQGKIAPDPLLASTGRIDPTGAVLSVGGIPAKVQAAVASGFRRVLVPADHEAEARSVVNVDADLTIVGVRSVHDLLRQLAEITGSVSMGVDGTARFIRKLLPLYGLDLVGERVIDNGYRLELEDASSKAYVDIFRSRRATVHPNGSGTALQSANRLVEERLSRAHIEPRQTLTVRMSNASRKDRLVQILEREGAQVVPVKSEHEEWRYSLTDGGSRAIIVAYKSGSVVIPNGQAPAHDTLREAVRKVLEGLGGFPESKTSVSSTPTADATVAHIGTDEAGKGDYFGPLVCAACYLDPEVAEILRALGVKDSKTLSDRTIRRLAAEIRSRLGGRFSVVTIPPRTYNKLYEQMRQEGKNLNSLVAWGHSRGIKDLVVDHKIDAEYAVIDKFADERYMRERLATDSRTRDLRLDQRTKAESDIAVAAASILARDAFVTWLEDQSTKLGLPLPKGAGEPVISAARRIVAQRGQPALGDVAKLSFKTTLKVLEAVP